jgi:hypothetical protein
MKILPDVMKLDKNPVRYKIPTIQKNYFNNYDRILLAAEVTTNSCAPNFSKLLSLKATNMLK